MMKTLLLQPPSCESVDGGAVSHYQVRRERREFFQFLRERELAH